MALEPARLIGIIEALASDALGGRYTTHPDIRRAAEVITSGYREAGVPPATAEGYLLDFEVTVGVDAGPGSALSIERGQERTAITEDSFVPRPEGSAGTAEGALVFVGYAIAPADDSGGALDELGALELGGKVALVLTGVPSVPEGITPRPRYGRRDRSLARKLERLADAGAIGAIVVEDPRAPLEPSAQRPALPDLREDRPLRFRAAIPALQLHASEAHALLPAGERPLGELQAEIDRTGQARSRALRGVRVRLTADVSPRVVTAPNVLAMVPGGELADEIVLLGAHYDHIGTAEPGHGHCNATPGPQPDRICNGADDNASGSAVVAELAMAMAAGPPPRRTVVFAHFAGEELGLLGSRDLAARLDTQPPFAGRRVVAMLNIDMVGRLRDPLTVSGVGSSPAWMEVLDRVGSRGMGVLYDRSLTTRSDHAPFYERGIPALFFFTGLHDDYHAPGDELPGIDRPGVVRVGELVGAIAAVLAEGQPIPFSTPRTPEEGLVGALPGDNPATVLKVLAPDGEVRR